MESANEQRGRVDRSSRNFVKAAGLMVGALAALPLSSRPANAQRDHGDRAGGNCFLRGTRIRTPLGYRKVEELAVGDFVLTRFASARSIRKIGSFGFARDSRDEAWPVEARPVRIARSAIGDNVPSDDLYLTLSHALYLDGVLVPAGDLVNGTTITIDDADDLDLIEYFHIMFDSHDVVDAEGMACESLLQPNDAASAEFASPYGAPAEAGEPCAPRLSFNGGRNQLASRLRSAVSPLVDVRQPLDRIRDRLEERALQ
jgi:hypothetical protein